jgi:hypothetical protein
LLFRSRAFLFSYEKITLNIDSCPLNKEGCSWFFF